MGEKDFFFFYFPACFFPMSGHNASYQRVLNAL
jgi:hypothetical protein